PDPRAGPPPAPGRGGATPDRGAIRHGEGHRFAAGSVPPPGPVCRGAMRIAFYAPLKPPTHPVPSGDRRMARLLMAALARANHQVRLASRFRSREGEGDPGRQASLARIGEHTADRL